MLLNIQLTTNPSPTLIQLRWLLLLHHLPILMARVTKVRRPPTEPQGYRATKPALIINKIFSVLLAFLLTDTHIDATGAN